MKRLLVASTVVLALALAGCAGTPDPSSTVIAKPSPSPSPSASPSSVAVKPSASPTKPRLDELIVSTEGLGPLVRGQAPPVTDPALDILVFDPDGCYFPPEEGLAIPVLDDYGIWLSNYGQEASSNRLGPFGVSMFEGKIALIGVYDEQIETENGAHLGMTREELLAAHPTLELETVGAGVDNYRLRGTTGDIVFSLWEREGAPFAVQNIYVGRLGFPVPMGGSDYGVFGVCYGP